MGRIPEADRTGKCDITHLWERHHTMLRMANLGLKHKEIAEILGCEQQTVSRVLNSEIAQMHLARMREKSENKSMDAQLALMKLGPDCVRSLKEVVEQGTLDGDKVSVNKRISTIMNILDRGPAPKQTNVKGVFAHMHVSSDEKLNEIKERARAAKESAARRGELICDDSDDEQHNVA